MAGPDQADTGDDHHGAPDVRGEMQRIGFEGFAFEFFCGVSQGAGASDIDGESDEEDQDGGDAGLNVDVMEEEAVKGFVDDVERGHHEQGGFDEGGKIFKLAVAVGMAFVGGLIGNAYG